MWQWQDPFTALYTKWQQHQLSSQYDKRIQSFDGSISGASISAERASVAVAAKNYRRTSKRGQALGRIQIPRMGINMVLVNGTDHDTLKKGPGRDERTFMPGENRLIYIAGHRTTYLAPFSHIDRLRAGDRVTIEVPYATFVYAVTRHRIVAATDLVRASVAATRDCSSCRRATRASSQRTATSRTHASCVSNRVARRPTSSRLRPAASSARSRPRRARRRRVAQARAHRRLPHRDDHVRLLARDRLERDAVTVCSDARAHELVAAARSAAPSRRAAREVRRARCGGALEARAAPAARRARPDERRDGVARQAEDERPPADAERERLAGLDRDAPEDLLDAELAEDPADEVVRPDGDAARRDEHVGSEPALERGAMRTRRRRPPSAGSSTSAPAAASAAASSRPFDS